MKIFQYDNELSSDYQLVVCYIDSAPGAETVDTISQKAYEQTNVVGTDEFVIVNDNYSSAITFPFQTIKMDNNCSVQPITPEEFSNINRWVNRDESHKFKCDKEGYEGIYFMGRFNIKPIKINDLIYGVDFTFISDYPYGFADEIVQTYSGTEFMIYNHSDEIGYLSPVIAITCKESGTLRIQNSMDNEIFELTDCTEGEVITIDSKNMLLTSTHIGKPLYNRFNFNYIKLCNTYTERRNNFTSTLDIDMEVKYSPVRKVGI